MADFLRRPLTSVALCWRLERRDGATLGFTAHDQDLTVGGILYRAAPGMLPSAIALSDGFDPDTLDVQGALSANAISAADLKAGRWDGAALSVFMIDWERPDGEALPIARGELSEVSIKGDAFEVELRGPTAVLDEAVVEVTSPECRARLGDKRCRVDLAARTRTARVTAIESNIEIEVDVGSPDGSWGYGQLRWLSGAGSGMASGIAASGGGSLTLRDPPLFPVAVGDMVELVEGCDRRFATCVSRFSNAANFRGEPHLPGMDLLTRYPGA